MANGLFTLKQVNQALRQSAWSNQKPASVNYLVVAGGGGGGQSLFGDAAGGGGAGGLLQGNYLVTAGTSITVTVGAGGNAGTNNGGNSVFGSISASGGGGGANRSGNANSGGSGGGGAWQPTNSSEGFGIFGQGNSGARMQSVVNYVPAGGGGGAGTSGVQYQKGGVGIASNITGTSTIYATGGDGGYNGTSLPASSGAANTGNGGYGGYSGSTSPANGGAGGSGIVVISYPDTYAAAASSTNATVTTSGSGSISFVRASGQYLTYANPSSQFSLGTNAFTIECWVRLSSMPSSTGYPASYWLFGGGPLNSNTGIDFYINNTQIGFNLVTFTSPTVIGNHGMTTNTWYHVAVVRGGSSNLTVSIFVNGTRVATGGSITDSADAATTGIAISAAEPSGATQGNLDGFISNYRVVKGTAVYDPTQSSITVPTAPLTAIPNTQLLLNTVSGAFAADASSNAFSTNAPTSISPTWNSASPFTVTGYKNRVYTWTTSGSITF